MSVQSVEGPVDASANVSASTSAKIRTFLFEVAEGVSNYRSLHSLTQQVEHQYHGRFLIELIQNAHDAFDEAPQPGRPNRIEILFDSADSKYGSLLVANDGCPFTTSNFQRLSQLGQSDKDPEKSIGNKGIGFRSVLEVSDQPEIYSRAQASSSGFDGYCFAFRPEVVQSLVKPIIELGGGGEIPVSPISGGPIVDWSEDLLSKFRRRVRDNGVEWLTGECKFLSPYLLPVPIREIRSAAVRSLEAKGFATVVRLPLKSEELLSNVMQQMERLTSSTVLFLEKVSSLTLRVNGDAAHVFSRSAVDLAEPPGTRQVTITDSESGLLEYAMWKRELHVAAATEEFRAALRSLPGRWPDINEISVSIAVRFGQLPDQGRFSIYLPTLVETGGAVHVNAPFFGDMSRTAISFDDAYNRELLKTAGDLAISVVRESLAGRGEVEATAIVDLLSPLGAEGATTSRWMHLINASMDRAGGSLDSEPLFLAESGWRPLNSTSLLPSTVDARLLTEEVLRQHATFEIFHSCLSSREGQLKDLADERYDTGAYPQDSDIAATIAAIARDLLDKDPDWNEFWLDVIALLPSGQGALADQEVLLGGDGRLHSAGSERKVFFVPRQGTQDDADISGEGAAMDVPQTLQSSIAFLSEKISLYEPSRPTVQTAVRTYLGNGLVSQFRVESIFANVFQEKLPALPVSLRGAQAELCRDALTWALRLVGNIVSRGRGAEATLRLLRTIPVPCQGGWFPMGEASFGGGWPETSGATLNRYLDSLTSPSAREARRRLLLPPGDTAWGEIGVNEQSLLMSGGVVDGLRLQEIRSDSWSSDFRAASYDFSLPSQPPQDISGEFWKAYKKVVEGETRPPFASFHTYTVGSVYIFPGFAQALSLSESGRDALSELVLQSLTHWSVGLAPLLLVKQGGQSDRRLVTSPLKYFLRSSPWLAAHDSSGPNWSRPFERWHVPSDALAGRARHFAHLKALPAALARQLDTQEQLAGLLRELGMPHFDLHSDTASPKLLEALTASVTSADAPDANVLLGQLRDAWHRFRPADNAPALARVVVRTQEKQLEVVAPTSDCPVFLPDYGAFASELEQFGLPVLTIYTDDAKSLRGWFTTAYGSRVQLTSTLNLVPQVNGNPWTGSSAIPLSDSELGWLISPLLALVAFYGQLRGIHSAAFQERVELLRQSRIDWVPNVAVAVMRDDAVLMTSSVPALWDAERKTIIAANACRMSPADLSVAISQALKRDDLELPLRVVLGRLDSVEEEPDDVPGVLSQLRVSAEQVQQVIEHMRGDIGHTARLLQILAVVFDGDADTSRLLEATTEEELASAIHALPVGDFDWVRLLDIARERPDMFDFGRATSRYIGSQVSLPRWNAALAQCGQRGLVNRSWATQLQAGLEEAAGLVKRVMAQLIRDGSQKTFASMLEDYEALPREVDLSESHWEVDFRTAMGIVATAIESWQGNDAIGAAIACAETVDGLRGIIDELGVRLDLDPDECARKNHDLVEAIAAGMERLRLAWWLKAGAQIGEWNDEIAAYRSATALWLGTLGFTGVASESEVFDLLRDSELHAKWPEFRSVMVASTNLASMQTALHISAEELDAVQARLTAAKVEAQRLRSVVKVCNEDFDSSEENRKDLWAFLQQRVPYESLAADTPLDLGKFQRLENLKTKAARKNSRLQSPAGKISRQSKAVDELVGLAGEMFVYRMLQMRYGNEVVSSSSWVSENSRYVFPHNLADDGRGCDFAFTVKGHLHRVEVKASSGSDETFTLGSSEIALALELASRKRGRHESFIIIHVKNALSTEPRATVLPNPYEPKYTGLFRIERSDARIRYRPK